MKLNEFTINDIRKYNPCYDPTRYLPEGWKGTALDILKHPSIPDGDKIWVINKNGISDETLHRFACWCAAEALFLVKSRNYKVDDRSWNAIKVKLNFVEGLASETERKDAADAAYAYAYAAYAAAYAAADAAADAAGAAAGAAADAAYDAADADAADAADAAYAAAADAARQKQIKMLIKMLEEDYVYNLSEFYNHG